MLSLECGGDSMQWLMEYKQALAHFDGLISVWPEATKNGKLKSALLFGSIWLRKGLDIITWRSRNVYE